ncbi:methylglyoxal reductase (NADPH-dependent) gre2 [Aspergillus wentii]|nr:methylglyoxal reductase (NADPH-dependent) gre2 [Aspergillus wentii]
MSLYALNTSNQRIRYLIVSASKEKRPRTGKHFVAVSSTFSTNKITNIIREELSQFQGRLPSGDGLKPGDYPEGGVYGFDNSRSQEVLGLPAIEGGYRGCGGKLTPSRG